MNTLRRSTWAIPAFLACTTLTALILALVAEGVWDWVAWTLLSLPTLLVARYGSK